MININDGNGWVDIYNEDGSKEEIKIPNGEYDRKELDMICHMVYLYAEQVNLGPLELVWKSKEGDIRKELGFK